MKAVNHLTDKEIRNILKKIGISEKSELDNAIAEYKKYWRSVYTATFEGNKNKDNCARQEDTEINSRGQNFREL
jgi:hypothetical protein